MNPRNWITECLYALLGEEGVASPMQAIGSLFQAYFTGAQATDRISTASSDSKDHINFAEALPASTLLFRQSRPFRRGVLDAHPEEEFDAIAGAFVRGLRGFSRAHKK